MRQIHTPCISICKLNESKTYCVGCKRTRNELFNWAALPEAEQLRIISELEKRTFDTGPVSSY
jgi:predicted Fe-S protein YdhL (DUF1289 family)